MKMSNKKGKSFLEFMFREKGNPEKLKFLVGSPFLPDNMFRSSVVFLIEHGEQGSFGLIVNKVIRGVSLAAIFPEIPENIDFPVSIGGPVNMERLFCLHTYPEIPEAVHVVDDIYMNGDIRHIIKGVIEGRYTPDRMRFFTGYSGWSRGQLAKEMKELSWIVVDEDPHIIFKDPSNDMWWKLLRNTKLPTRLLSYVPDNLMLN